MKKSKLKTADASLPQEHILDEKAFLPIIDSWAEYPYTVSRSFIGFFLHKKEEA